MSLQNSYERFDNYIHVLSRRMGAKSSAKHYFELFKQNNIPVRHLSKEQKQQVHEAWNGFVKGSALATHELVYTATGNFNPYVCSELFFRTNIELALNNFKLKYGFSEKNYFDILCSKEPMPHTIIRNVNGVFLDTDYKPLSEKEVFELLKSYDSVIVKPSIDNGFGKSVKLYNKDEFDNIIKDFKKNYLVQEVLKQHASIAAFNPSSINVVRVVSLSMNGVVTPVNYALRCGAAGSITDNFISKDGKGMIVIGIEPDGHLKDKAYYSCGQAIEKAPNGAEFAGVQLPNFKEALEMTTRVHERFPHFGFIGFDVCFDEDGSPRIMELNFRGPGVLYYQYANGPLFGERTQEVIDKFCK